MTRSINIVADIANVAAIHMEKLPPSANAGDSVGAIGRKLVDMLYYGTGKVDVVVRLARLYVAKAVDAGLPAFHLSDFDDAVAHHARYGC